MHVWLLLNPLDLVSNEAGLDSLMKVVLFFLIVFGIFFWLAVVTWTIQDIVSRTHDLGFQLFATTLVMLFHLLGLAVYILFRPRRTLEEKSYDSMEQELLQQSVSPIHNCPQCHQRLEPDFLICPACQTEVRHQCPHCKKVIQLDWGTCPFCKNEVESHNHRKNPHSKKGNLAASNA